MLLFFVTNGEIFPPLKSLLFFAGREKEKFSVSFHCLVCVCHEDDDEKAEKIFFIFFLFIEGNAIPWSGVMEDNVLKSNASEWHSYVGYILSYCSARERIKKGYRRSSFLCSRLIRNDEDL